MNYPQFPLASANIAWDDKITEGLVVVQCPTLKGQLLVYPEFRLVNGGLYGGVQSDFRPHACRGQISGSNTWAAVRAHAGKSITLASVAVWNGSYDTSARYPWLIGCAEATGGIAMFFNVPANSGAVAVYAQRYWAGPASESMGNSYVVTGNQPVAAIFRYSDQNDTRKLWVENSRNQAAANVAQTGDTTSSANLMFGSASGTVYSYSYFGARWDRELTDEEAQRWLADPFCFLRSGGPVGAGGCPIRAGRFDANPFGG